MNIRFGKIITYTVTSAAVVLTTAADVLAVPVVPNFTQGSMTSHTETTSKVTETINSMDYNTGYQYVITGTNMEHDGVSISPPAIIIFIIIFDFIFIMR